jgi:hypothetical protein
MMDLCDEGENFVAMLLFVEWITMVVQEGLYGERAPMVSL